MAGGEGLRAGGRGGDEEAAPLLIWISEAVGEDHQAMNVFGDQASTPS